MTETTLADLLFDKDDDLVARVVGVHPDTARQWRQGRSSPQRRHFAALQALLGVGSVELAKVIRRDRERRVSA